MPEASTGMANSRTRPSFPLALALVALWALVALITFGLTWRGLAGTPASPSPAELESAIGAVPRWMVGLRDLLFLVALLYPVWAVAHVAAPGRGRWAWPVLLLAGGVAASALRPILIHLRAPRGSLLWDQEFGIPLRIHGFATEWTVAFDAGETAVAATLIFTLGLFALGLAARVSAGATKPLRGFLIAALALLIGHLIHQWWVYSHALWRWEVVCSALIALGLLMLSMPLWWRLDTASRAVRPT